MKHIDIVKLLMAGNICMSKYFASCAPIRESPSRSMDLSCSLSLSEAGSELGSPARGARRWHRGEEFLMITEQQLASY